MSAEQRFAVVFYVDSPWLASFITAVSRAYRVGPIHINERSHYLGEIFSGARSTLLVGQIPTVVVLTPGQYDDFSLETVRSGLARIADADMHRVLLPKNPEELERALAEFFENGMFKAEKRGQGARAAVSSHAAPALFVVGCSACGTPAPTNAPIGWRCDKHRVSSTTPIDD